MIILILFIDMERVLCLLCPGFNILVNLISSNFMAKKILFKEICANWCVIKLKNPWLKTFNTSCLAMLLTRQHNNNHTKNNKIINPTNLDRVIVQCKNHQQNQLWFYKAKLPKTWKFQENENLEKKLCPKSMNNLNTTDICKNFILICLI